MHNVSSYDCLSGCQSRFESEFIPTNDDEVTPPQFTSIFKKKNNSDAELGDVNNSFNKSSTN